MKSIAIMQPTFLPWIGYFALIDRVDEFIFLDNVQFDRRSWQQRNQIKTANGASWLTVPVQNKGLRDQLIQDVKIQYNDSDPLLKITKSIEHNYKNTPYYKDYGSALANVLTKKPALLNTLNIDIILFLCEAFGIQQTFVNASALSPNGSKADLLLDICLRQGADTYISPPGSQAYLQETDVFEKSGVKIGYHNYDHPVYNQPYGDFLPYVCGADLLFNEGPNSLKILRSGITS